MNNIPESYWKELEEKLEQLPGNLSVVYRNLSNGEEFQYREGELHIAASVIKLFLMAAVYQGFEDGKYQKTDRILIKRENCVPSCGVINYLQEEQNLWVRDLVELMVIVSDNTATNALFDFVGEEELNKFIHETLHMPNTAFRRKMFDSKRAAMGIENHITAEDVAQLLEKIYRGTLISEEASREMYQILTHQRLNGKVPFYLHALPKAPVIAHKTGEDSGVTHDVGVIEGAQPFIFVFLGNDTNVPEYEKLMAETSLEVYKRLNC